MPSGDVAPGWVLPTCGFGHHQVAATPRAGGRSVAAVPMKGSICSMISPTYPARTPRLVTPRLTHPSGQRPGNHRVAGFARGGLKILGIPDGRRTLPMPPTALLLERLSRAGIRDV